MLSKKNLQLNDNGDLHHLLAIEGLPKRIIERILDTAESFVGINEREVKVVPLLRGKSIFNIFFENSTRTRTTFEIAAKRLSADVVSLDVARSSTTRAKRFSTPSPTSLRCTPICSSCATPRAARHI